MLSILEQIEAANRQPETSSHLKPVKALRALRAPRAPRPVTMSRNGLPKRVYDLLADGVPRTVAQTAADLGVPIFRAREALGALSRREQIEWQGHVKDRTYWRNV